MIKELALDGEPLGVMQLSAIAKQQGWDTKLTTADRNYLHDIKYFKPDLIAISSMSPDYNVLKQAMAKIKCEYKDIFILLGGPHPTFSPECINDCEADAICIGEGEGAFVDVVNALIKNDKIQHIDNISIDGHMPKLRPLVTDLDALPFVDRELIYSISKPMYKFKLKPILTTRGCPFQCTYCFNHAFKKMYRGLGPIVRRRSVDSVIREIVEIKNRYPVEIVKFVDDSFILKHDEWLEEFATIYKNKINMPYYCLMRTEVVTKDIVLLLKNSGCTSVAMSIETANQRIRKELLSRNVTNDQIINAFDLFNAAGIGVFTNNMLGIPTSTLQDELDTIKLNIRCKPGYASFTIFLPFPGTQLYNYCVENNLIDQGFNTDKMPSNVWGFSVLKSYSESEKRFQKNINSLGAVAIRWPSLYNFIVRRMLPLPPNIVYRFIWILTKNFLMKKNIIKMSFSFTELATLGISQLKANMRQSK